MKVIERATTPNGIEIQIEDWSANYNFMAYAGTVAAYPTQDAADEAATITCRCEKAREYQQQLEKAAERDKNITKLRESIDDFAEYCEKRNTELKGELHDLLLVAGISVLDGVVDSVNFKFGRLKVNISTNSKGNIVIGFTYSDGAKVEV